MDEKKTELLAGLKGLSEEDLDAIAGGLNDIDQSLLNGIIAMAKSKGLSLDETIAKLPDIKGSIKKLYKKDKMSAVLAFCLHRKWVLCISMMFGAYQRFFG